MVIGVGPVDVADAAKTATDIDIQGNVHLVLEGRIHRVTILN